MKTTLKLIFAFSLIISIFYYPHTGKIYGGGRAGCEAYIYISNNSLFVCELTIDGIPQVGSMLVGKTKVFPVELLNDTPKRIKVKVIYEQEGYLESKSYILITKKLECGQMDSLYIAHTK